MASLQMSDFARSTVLIAINYYMFHMSKLLIWEPINNINIWLLLLVVSAQANQNVAHSIYPMLIHYKRQVCTTGPSCSKGGSVYPRDSANPGINLLSQG